MSLFCSHLALSRGYLMLHITVMVFCVCSPLDSSVHLPTHLGAAGCQVWCPRGQALLLWCLAPWLIHTVVSTHRRGWVIDEYVNIYRKVYAIGWNRSSVVGSIANEKLCRDIVLGVAQTTGGSNMLRSPPHFTTSPLSAGRVCLSFKF